MFVCHYCGNTFKKKKSLNNHVRIHLLEEAHCDKCMKTFISKESLRNHRRLVHPEKSYSCDICQKNFSTNGNLCNHKKAHDEVHLIQCDVCQKKFTNTNIKRHIISCRRKEMKIKIKTKKRKSSTKSTPLIQCESESQSDEEPIDVSKEGLYNCQHCNKKFKIKSSVERHVIRIHKYKQGESFRLVDKVIKPKKVDINATKCLHCDKTFSNTSNMTNHLKKIHNTNKNKVEHEKLDRFSYKDSFMIFDDEVSPSTNREAKCAQCGHLFQDAYSLQKHISTIHENRSSNKCEFCMNSFSNKQNLNQHVKNRHGKNQEHQCHLCLEFLFDASTLKKHIKRHENKKPMGRKPKNDDEIGKKQLKRRAKKLVDAFNAATGHSEALRAATMKNLIQTNYDMILKWVKLEKDPLTVDEIVKIIINANLSDRQVYKVLDVIKAKWGTDITVPNIKEALAMRKKGLLEFFSYSKETFESKNGPINRTITICHNIEGFIISVSTQRGYCWQDMDYIIGVDDGKGILKITLTMIPKSNSGESNNEDTTENHPEASERYNEMFKDEGVKKVMVLASVAGVPETYENIRKLFSFVHLDRIIYQLSQDLKMINICCGMTSHSSKYPCPFGLCSKNPDGTWKKGENRTVENLMESYRLYTELADGDRSQLKNYFNVEYAPIIEAKTNGDETVILEKCPPPPLHLRLGATNALAKVLKDLDPEAYAAYVKCLSIVKENYHGKTFEGNECNKILKNCEKLKKGCKKCAYSFESESLDDIVSALEAIRHFIQDCGGKKVTSFWSQSIEEVRNTWTLLHTKYGITIPNKVHIIMDHVGDYIEATKKGLGCVSDHIVEAAHSALNKRLVGSNYWVKDLESDRHGLGLFRCILHFNSYNI